MQAGDHGRDGREGVRKPQAQAAAAPSQLAADPGSQPAATVTALHGDKTADPQLDPAAPAAVTPPSVAAAFKLAQGLTEQAASSATDVSAAARDASQPKARSRRANLFVPRGPTPVAAGPQQFAVQLMPGMPPVMVHAVPGMTAQQVEQQAVKQAGLTCMNPGKPDLADISGMGQPDERAADGHAGISVRGAAS